MKKTILLLATLMLTSCGSSIIGEPINVENLYNSGDKKLDIIYSYARQRYEEYNIVTILKQERYEGVYLPYSQEHYQGIDYYATDLLNTESGEIARPKFAIADDYSFYTNWKDTWTVVRLPGEQNNGLY